MNKWAVVFFVFYILNMTVPVSFLFSQGIPLSKPVNPTIMSGFITASGIFLGFLSTVLISRNERLEILREPITIMMFINYFVFFVAIFWIFEDSTVTSEFTVLDLSFLMSSLVGLFWTAVAIFLRLLQRI